MAEGSGSAQPGRSEAAFKDPLSALAQDEAAHDDITPRSSAFTAQSRQSVWSVPHHEQLSPALPSPFGQHLFRPQSSQGNRRSARPSTDTVAEGEGGVDGEGDDTARDDSIIDHGGGLEEIERRDGGKEDEEEGTKTPRSVRSFVRPPSPTKHLHSTLSTHESIGRPTSRSGGTSRAASPPLESKIHERQSSMASRWQALADTSGVHTEEEEDEAGSGAEDESSMLAKLHQLPDAEIASILGVSMRLEASNAGSPILHSGGQLRPPLLPHPTSSQMGHSLSSPTLPDAAKFQSSPEYCRDPTYIAWLKKLSKALARSVEQAREAQADAERQSQEHAKAMALQKRTFQVKENAMRSICEQSGVSLGQLDRAVARAVADMPQVQINVQEQMSRHDATAPPWSQHKRSQRTAADELAREHRQSNIAASSESDVGLGFSLKEAMLDNLADHASSQYSQLSPSARSFNSPATPHSTRTYSTTRTQSTDHQQRQQSPNRGTLGEPLDSPLSSSISIRDGERKNIRRPSAKASEGLMAWRQDNETRKACATTQATSPAAAEVDGPLSDGAIPSEQRSISRRKSAARSKSRPHSSDLQAPAASPASSTNSHEAAPNATRGGYGFFGALGWRRKKADAPRETPIHAEASSGFRDAIDQQKLLQANHLQPPSTQQASLTDDTSDLRSATVLGVHQMSRTASGGDVASALHEAIGSAPITPSEEPGHKIDLKSLPKPTHIKAVFLATRVLGPDANNLLTNHGRGSSPMIVEKARELVFEARQSGLEIEEQVKPASKSTDRSSLGVQARSMSISSARAAKTKSMAVQAATAVMDAAQVSTSPAIPAEKKMKTAKRVPSKRVEPNVTRLPQYFGISGAEIKKNSSIPTASASDAPDGKDPRAPVELEPMVAPDVVPPTLALRQNKSTLTPRQLHRANVARSDADEGESSGDEFEVYGGKGRLVPPKPIDRASFTDFDERAVDVFGFVYDATPTDVRLLRQARKASMPAPACLAGVRIGAARGNDDDAEHDSSEAKHERLSDAEDTDLEESETEQDQTSWEKQSRISGDQGDGANDSGWSDPNISSSSQLDHSPPETLKRSRQRPPNDRPASMFGLSRAKPSTGASKEVASSLLKADGGPTSPEQERKSFQSSRSGGTPDDKGRAPKADVNSTDRKPKPISETIKHLLDQLKTMHSKHQAEQVEKWESFIEHRRRVRSESVTDREDFVPAAGTARGRKYNGSMAPSASNASSPRPMPRPADDYQFGIVGIRQMGDDKAGREDRSRFLRLCQDGIPLVYRPKVWTECSGATETAEPGRYQDLLDEHRGETNQCLAQIDLDIHRTMPTNIYFSGDGPGVPKLRRILAAYSWYSPEVGYCQGMNNLAATLLLTHPSEEEAFWVLVCIIEKILPREYYTSHLLVSQADQRVLLDLIREVLPSLANHLEDLGVDLPAVTFAWFLSLYTDCLPVEVSWRLLLCA